MRVILIISLLLLSNCTSVKYLQATGGSKADGVVNLSYTYGLFEEPIVDSENAYWTAKQRCNAWGYNDAQAFGGSTSTCQDADGYGSCDSWLVTVPYQCTGQLTPPQK